MSNLSTSLREGTQQSHTAAENTAFLFNRDMAHELEADVKAAIGEHTFDLLTRQDCVGSTERHPRGVDREPVAK